MASGVRISLSNAEGYAWHRGSISSPDVTELGFTMTSIARGAEPALSELHRQQMLAELSGWHVETVIVGPMVHRDRVVAFISWLLQRPPTPVATSSSGRYASALRPRCTGGRSTRGTAERMSERRE